CGTLTSAAIRRRAAFDLGGRLAEVGPLRVAAIRLLPLLADARPHAILAVLLGHELNANGVPGDRAAVGQQVTDALFDGRVGAAADGSGLAARAFLVRHGGRIGGVTRGRRT